MQLFNEDDCYTIDGKSHGNVGRYFNHSCTPNLVVQSVFVDTHDLRYGAHELFILSHIYT